MSIVVSADVIARLKALLGDGGFSQDPARLAPKLLEWRDRWSGETPLLVLPKSTAEVAAVVEVCAQVGAPITPQGGNTGLVGGQIPRGEILLSLDRMRAIRHIDPLDDALTVEAGAPLISVQQAAQNAGRLFPLSLASEGTATIGGLVSTNAGGTAVLRYGNMRELVLGIEAVLPNGQVFSSLKSLRKDNTGYDLKQLLIGAEGTLGVVTAATLKLFPRPISRTTAMAGMRTPADAVALLARAKQESAGGIEAFELMSRMGVDFALRHIPGLREPLAQPHPWYVLIEAISSEPAGADAALERLLAWALETDLVQDAAIAQSQGQAKAFWRLREDQSAAQKPEGLSWKHDVSVPVSKVAELIERAGTEIGRRWPGVRIAAFGHVGDGNIHYNISEPQGGDPAFEAGREACARLVHDLVNELGGSISAEHGLGVMKSEEALRYKSLAEVATMRAVRQALDPKRIMNPRVLF